MSDLNVEKITIPQEHHGQRIDAVLAQIFPQYSRSQLTQWLKDGAIIVNDQSVKPKDKVRGGEVVLLRASAPQTDGEQYLAEKIPLDVVFEDQHLLVVNKQAGLVVHPGAGNPRHTLVNALLYHEPSLHQLPRAGIIHRLDKDTSGLLIVAKTFAAHTSLVRQMQAREIHRCYLALVHGHVVAGGKLETFYGRHPRNRLKMSVLNQGREAITEYMVRKHYEKFALLDVTLMTGRTHQIRVHMAHIHHPIVGDPLYGGRARMPAGIPDALKQQLQSFSRQALHAYHLSFAHPDTLEQLTLTIPLPDDFQMLLNSMDENLE